jgi:hypothetical protein
LSGNATRATVSPKLADAFFEAVRAYIRWSFGGPEPSIIVERSSVPISAVCERLNVFTDPLPDELFNTLYFLLADRTEKHLRERLNADRTYASAAAYLLKLIEGRQAEWREEWQRTQ